MINQEAVNRQAEQRIEKRKSNRAANLRQLDALKAGKDFDWTKVEKPPRLAERARQLGLYEAAGVLLSDPSDSATGKRVFEQIIGANNLLGATFLIEGARMARAVGRIALPVAGGTRLGTGFMVAPRIMMTNNHVLGDSSEAASATLEFDFYEREDGMTGPVIRFRLRPDEFFVTDGPLDFTLAAVEAVNVDGVTAESRGWFPLLGPSGKAVVGERVSIIQHPNGEPQKVTVHDNEIVDFDGDFIHYATDTMGGSSGSPVLNINWDLAALHHAAAGNTNEGIRISSVVRKLREIFDDEATAPGVDRRLLNELMSSRAMPPVDTAPPAPAHPGMTGSGPQLRPDGTATWVVPVTISIGIGQSAVPAAAPAAPAGHGTPAPGEAPAEDPVLRRALQALEDTEGRVYYSRVEDEQARNGYYPDLQGLSKTDLYDTLSTLVADTHTTSLSYSKARLEHLYPWIDRRDNPGRDLRGLYSNKVFDALEVIRQEARMEHLREQAIRERMAHESTGIVDEAFLESLEAAFPFNCEHVVPQSWFRKKKVPKTDLHHLFTCEWGCNSFRGNRAYFDFRTEAFREDCGESDDGMFEPQHGKGAAARATLYFLLRYPGEIADLHAEMPKDRLATLIKWAKGDRVDRWERHRNAEIHKIQGNRNPLIDFPELVDRIDFERGWA